MDLILQRLDELEKLIKEHNLATREVLNFNETCDYLELSKSHLYKLTSQGAIPHYKPNGKKLYFKRTELDTWLLRNRFSSKEEVAEKVDSFKLKTRQP